MTNLEAISNELYPYDVDEMLIVKRCMDYSLDANAEYLQGNKVAIAQVVISILRKNLIAIQSENNGGYSLSYREISTMIRNIALENGLKDIAEEFNEKPRVYIGID